jgi:hypothetical protein
MNTIDIKKKSVSYSTALIENTAATGPIQTDGGIVVDLCQGLGLGWNIWPDMFKSSDTVSWPCLIRNHIGGQIRGFDIRVNL